MHIKPGDAVTRQKLGFWGNFYTHYAIYLQDEDPQIIERTEIGIRQISFERFQKGHDFTVIPYRGKESREKVIERALSLKDDTTFKPLTKNCESFVYFCHTGKEKWSWQIRDSLTLLGLFFIFIAIIIYKFIFII